MKQSVIAMTLLLASCGGGGSGGVAGPSTRLMTTNIIRTIQNNDFIQYQISGTSTTAGVTSALTGTATKTFTLTSPADLAAATHSTETTVSNLSVGGVPQAASTSALYFGQVAGTINVWGESGSGWITTAPGYVPRLVSPVTVGQTWTNTYNLQSGEQIIDTVTVNGTEVVTIPLGSFQAYKITFNQVRQSKPTPASAYATTQTNTDVYDLVPSIGIIKMSGTLNIVSPPQTVSEVGQMTTTNIAY